MRLRTRCIVADRTDAHAELKKMGVETETEAQPAKERTHAEEVHDHRVIGGLKAATHNPARTSVHLRSLTGQNVSEEAKEHARESAPRSLQDHTDMLRARGDGRVRLIAAVRAMHIPVSRPTDLRVPVFQAGAWPG